MHEDNQTPIVSSSMASNARASAKKIWLAVIVAAVVVLAVGATWMVLTRKHTQVADTAAKQIAGPGVNITINGLSPATIKIKLGQEVTWTNQDTRQHELTADQSLLAGFDSVDPLMKGDSYTFTFDTAGTFHYYDPADPKGYNGTVVVQ